MSFYNIGTIILYDWQYQILNVLVGGGELMEGGEVFKGGFYWVLLII